MSKRKETLAIEHALADQTREDRIYGCEEVTIGFANMGKGNEIADFVTMDSKGIVKCYEIKVTLPDLKSRAKKSFYGHYNFLIVTNELYDKVEDWSQYIPDHVGVISAKICTSGAVLFRGKRKARKQILSLEENLMMKNSLVRSLYFKMLKYQDAQSIEKQRELQAKAKAAEKEKEKYFCRAVKAENLIYKYENYRIYNEDLEDFSFEEEVKKEEQKFREKRQSEREVK